MDKYIESDLKQAKLYQISALNNILASFEAKDVNEYKTKGLSIDIIMQVLVSRYGNYALQGYETVVEFSDFYEDLKIIIDLMTGEIIIYEDSK